ncbi:SPOSA6832_01975, partial [Sporobolomyces salmonicolor]
MRVVPVPCRSDNYQYILLDETTGTTAVVDPYDPDKLEAAAQKEGVKIGEFLLTTHGHHDHAGGNEEMTKRCVATFRGRGGDRNGGRRGASGGPQADSRFAWCSFPGIKVYAGASKVSAATDVLKHGDKFKIGSLDVTAVATPCHTQDHICYFVEDKAKDERVVFTGDTLFVSGCGRFFEGSPQEMHVALNERLAALPDDTITMVGHEYTTSNVAFSKRIDPSNEAILKLEQFCKENEVTTGKFTIGDEKKHNVFMRTTSPAVQKATNTTDAIKAMGALREMKVRLFPPQISRLLADLSADVQNKG